MSVALKAEGVQITPGASGSFNVEVSNLGSVVDRFRCDIVGLPADWVSVSPASLELFPQGESADARARGTAPPSVGRFTVTVRPPRSSEARSGPWPIGAKVTSEADPTSRTVEEGTVVFLPFGALEAHLHPAVGAGRFGADGRLEIVNRGNRPETVSLTGSDPAERVRFEVEADSAMIEPGATSKIPYRLTAGGPKIFGGRETLPFVVGIRAASVDTPPINLAGVFEHRVLVPSGLPIAGATILALAMGAVAVMSLMRPADSSLSDNKSSPSPGVTVAAGSLAPATTAGATAAPATLAPSTATPSPTPTPSATVSPVPIFVVDPTITAGTLGANPLGTGDCTGLLTDAQIDLAVAAPAPAAIAVVQLWVKRPGEKVYTNLQAETFQANGFQYSAHIRTGPDGITTGGTLSFYIVAIDSTRQSAKSKTISIPVKRCDTPASITLYELNLSSDGVGYSVGECITPVQIPWYFGITERDGLASATMTLGYSNGQPSIGSIPLKIVTTGRLHGTVSTSIQMTGPSVVVTSTVTTTDKFGGTTTHVDNTEFSCSLGIN